MNILITGGTGFIGSNLIQVLSKEDNLVVLTRQKEPKLLLESDAKNLTFERGDLSDLNLIDGIFKKREINIVIHLASVYRTDVTEEGFRKIDVGGMQNLIKISKKYGLEHFIFCSTIDVYGSSREPLDENAPQRPHNVYSKAKNKAEQLLIGSDLRYTILQPATVYGPGDKRLLKLFRMTNKGKFIVFGDGESFIHPTYVKDLVNFIKFSLNNEKCILKTFIVAEPSFYTKNIFFSKVAQALGKDKPKIYIPYTVGYVLIWMMEKLLRNKSPLTVRSLDFFVAERAYSVNRMISTGFIPKYSLEDGLRETVDWYKSKKWIE